MFERLAGRYCVEFNTFVNDQDGLRVLDLWINDCIEDCSYGKSNDVMGDQKYLEKWPNLYPYICISKNQGAGVAPWNVNKFVFNRDENAYYVNDKDSEEKWQLVFFHYQNIQYLEDGVYYCCDVENDNGIVRELYFNYLLEIENAKNYLETNFGIKYRISIHPAELEKKNKEINESLALKI